MPKSLKQQEQPNNDNQFGFSEAWFSLNVVSAGKLAIMEEQFLTGDDKHLEHYRWQAFTDFVRTNRPLSHNQAVGLWQLGEMDKDISLGGAMMAELLRFEECQVALVELALASDRLHLVKIANELRKSKED